LLNGLVQQSPLPVRVHLVSDMQRTAMPERFADLAISGIDALQLYSTAAPDDRNVSVTAVVIESADNLTALSALVQNHAAQAVSTTIVVSSATGELERREIQLAADARTLVPFDALDTRDAEGSLTIALTPGDELPLDDVFTIAIPDGERSDVTLLGGIRNSVAATYVTAAIESDPRYRARLLTGDSVAAAEVGAMVIVPDASTLTDRAGSDLQDYLSNGGSALIIAGSEPHSASTRSLMNIASRGAESPSTYRVTTTDNTQPLVQDVAGDWRALRLQQLLPVSVDAGDRVILSTDNNRPLLLERTVGNGRLLVFTSALDPLWNNLALEPLFVPFIIRSIEYLRGESASNRSLAIGDAISLSPGAQLLDSNGKSLRELAELNQRGSFTFTEPGVYTVRSTAGNRYLSVNTDPQESSLEVIDAAQMEQWQNLGVTTAVAGNTAGNTDDNASDQQSLWIWILLSLLAVAMAESLYSHRHLLIKRGA
jgi:hypothetical protein